MHTFEIYEEYYDWIPLKSGSEAQTYMLEYGGEDAPNIYQPKESLIAKSYPEDASRTRKEYKRLLWMELNGVNGVPKPVTLYEEDQACLFYLALPGRDAETFFHSESSETIISTLKQIGRYLSFFHKQSIDGCPFVYSEEGLHTDLVFSHGDFSLSNIIVNENYITGSVDVSGIGVRDRYFDLAVMTRDIERHLGNKYLEHFYEGYRIKDDLDIEKLSRFMKITAN
ncbi:phosphotransferase [Salinicoccus sesuvii]|uniref:Phosphotransferase n=1 Tax=Salinicoccus sesuvii TaxID=868281 RepID=A0ABV7N0J4_9STAP